MLVPKGKKVCIGGRTFKSGQELPEGVPAKLTKNLEEKEKLRKIPNLNNSDGDGNNGDEKGKKPKDPSPFNKDK